MARKDVDLVIRAKDEAENVVRAITKALNDFNGAQKTTVAGAEKTDTALGKLGAAFAGLQKAVGGASVGAKIAEEMGRADAAVARLEASTSKTREELTRMKAEVASAETALAGLTVETEKQAKAQIDQVKAIGKAKTELAALRTEINTLEQATKGLVSQQTKLPEAILKQEAAIAKTSARLDALNATYAAADKPGKTLTSQIAATNTKLVDQTSRLSDLKQELTSVGTKLGSTGEDMAKLAQKAGAAETALKKQTGDLKDIKKSYSDISAAARSAAQSQIAASTSVDKLTGKLANEEAQLQVAKIGLIELSKAAGLSNEQLAKLAGEGISRLESSLARQKSILAGAKEQYASLSAAAINLEDDIGRAGVPTRKMSEDLAVLKSQVAGSKIILDSASLSFREMAQSFRTGGKDLAGLEQIEKSFVATQGQMSQAIQRSTSDYQKNLVAIKALHAEQARGNVGGGGGGVSRPALPPVAPAPPVGPFNQLSDAFNRLYGDSRKSLSITQRLRGEVLSLVAAYGGFYGVVSLLGQVLGAYQKLEAAQARLNVANNGNIAQSAEDLDFLRRTADRLGVDLGTLAEEYSKFSIATLGTNLAGEKTRKIFLSVAEAARVNRSTTEEVSGVFVALTQIVSKGSVQMEELRQQLGDRLPGALQIMADGLNVTTAELIKMTSEGKVSADALVPFAEELDKRFGPGLGEALAGTTVALGRLKNASFQALVGFGKGGFIDAFTQLANKLTDLLQSADFKAFIESASTAFSFLINVLSSVVDNFQLFVAVVAGFAGLKLAPILIGIVIGFKEIVLATKAAIVSQVAVRASLAATGAIAGTAAVGMGAFRAALTALISSTGIGLAITAIAAGIGYWAANADTATEALQRHKEILDLVKNAYDATKGSVDDWRKAVEGLTVTEAQKNLKDLQTILADTGKSFDSLTKKFISGGRARIDNLPGVSENQIDEVSRLRKEFIDGTIDGKKFLKGLDDLNQKYKDGEQATAEYADSVIAAAKELIAVKEATDQAGLVLGALTGDVDSAGEALDKLANSTEDFAKALSDKATAGLAEFNKKLTELKEFLPEVDKELIPLSEKLAAIQLSFEGALAAARALPDEIMRIAAAQDALKVKDLAFGAANGELSGGTDGATATLIKEFEGFLSDPKWDVNAFRGGFGSDTIQLADGTIKKVTEGITISLEDANRDLARRIGEFQDVVKGQIGGDRFASFSDNQQAALTSIAYNYGSLPDRILAAVRSGTTAEISTAIKSLAGDNNGINSNRRNREADIFAAGGDANFDVYTKAEEERRKAAEEAAKAAKAASDATKESLADGQFAIEQQTQINAGKERQAAIEAAIRAAKAKDPAITQEQIDKIAEQTGKVYDLAHAEELANKPKEAAAKAEELVNNLLSKRTSLQEQLNIAQEENDVTGQAALKTQIEAVNGELVTAIENAKQMWLAVGGPEADAAIAKLDLSSITAKRFGDQAKQNYLDWKKVTSLLVDGLAGAFDSFAQKIADGVKPMQALKESFLQFASDFLLQIAQMIIKQAIFNALQGMFGGTGFGSLIGLAHTGGVVGSNRAGSGNGSRRVSPGLFAGAPRYHVGGVVGLRPGEVPMIAKKGEEVLTQSDPRNVMNGGKNAPAGGAPSEPKVSIINGIDSASFLEAALNSPVGERVLLNWMRANADAVSGSR